MFPVIRLCFGHSGTIWISRAQSTVAVSANAGLVRSMSTARRCDRARLPSSEVQKKKITTIEGLPENHPVKQAWIKEQVPQCGYCQPGVIMQVAAHLSQKPTPNADQVISKMDDVICRCGSYPHIKAGHQNGSSNDEKGGQDMKNTSITRRAFLKGSLAVPA